MQKQYVKKKKVPHTPLLATNVSITYHYSFIDMIHVIYTVTISFQNHTQKAPDVTFLAYDMKHTGTTYLIDSLEVYIYFFIINCKLSE